MRIVVTALTIALSLAACTERDAVEADKAWVRLPAVAGRPAAGYFTIHGGPAPATLISLSADAAIRSELHATMTRGTMSSMRPLASVAIPARTDVAFAPGGRHAMLFDVNPKFTAGTRMMFTLTLADGTRIVTKARVIGAGDPAPDL